MAVRKVEQSHLVQNEIIRRKGIVEITKNMKIENDIDPMITPAIETCDPDGMKLNDGSHPGRKLQNVIIPKLTLRKNRRILGREANLTQW